MDTDIDTAIASVRRPAGAPMNAAISNALVRIHHEHFGRGPTRARTTIDGDTITVTLYDVFTQAERTLIAAGHRDQVLALRRTVQAVMRDEIAAAIESLTGRRVAALMSASHIEPDLAIEVCVLEARGNTTPSLTRVRSRADRGSPA